MSFYFFHFLANKRKRRNKIVEIHDDNSEIFS